MAITLPHEAMTQLFDATPDNDLPPVPNYNVCPTVPVHTVTSSDGTRRLRAMRWGFIPHWYKNGSGSKAKRQSRGGSHAPTARRWSLRAFGKIGSRVRIT